jgi:hypothetical protein
MKRGREYYESFSCLKPKVCPVRNNTVSEQVQIEITTQTRTVTKISNKWLFVEEVTVLGRQPQKENENDQASKLDS